MMTIDEYSEGSVVTVPAGIIKNQKDLSGTIVRVSYDKTEVKVDLAKLGVEVWFKKAELLTAD